LGSLKTIEELSLGGVVTSRGLVTSVVLDSLARLEHLRKLHIPLEYKQPAGPNSAWEAVPQAEPADLDRSVRALQTLRQTHLGIVIDGDFNALAWNQTGLIPLEYDTRDRLQMSSINHAIDAWKKAGCPPIPAPKPAK
jgi:hypothetical protein